jgi:ParB/RepB/Spo0J family partition protein
MMGEVNASIEVAPSELRSSLCALRLCAPEAQQEMQLSLSRLGQLTPVLAWSSSAGANLEIFDGMKRWRAAQTLSWPKLRVEVHALDALGAKVRLLRSNESLGLSELEEAWLVRSLYREDSVSQPQIAQLLSRHKSWVCRRLALAEQLSDELTASVRLGLVSTTAVRELTRLPRGNQDAVAQVVTRQGLTTRQTARLVDALLPASQEQWPRLLEQAAGPRLVENTESQGPKGAAPRRTPGEQLCADAWAMKQLAVRLQTRLLERSLQSLGPEACATVGRELGELRAALFALTGTLDTRLLAAGASDAAA